MSKSKIKISCTELLEFVSDNLLEKIEKKTRVNYQVKKIKGRETSSLRLEKDIIIKLNL